MDGIVISDQTQYGIAFCRKQNVVLPCIVPSGYRHTIQGEGMRFPDGTKVIKKASLPLNMFAGRFDG